MTSTREKMQYFKPLTEEPRTFVFAGADTEGVGGPGGFISGGVLIGDDYTEFSHQQDMLAYMHERRFKSVRWSFHNLAYDFGILEPWLLETDYPLLINGRPFKVRLDKGDKNPSFMIDSLLFSAGLSLAKIGDSIGLPKLKTPPELLTTPKETEEWTCDKHNKLWCVECYLRRDTEIVTRYMNLFQQTVNRLGGEVQFTLASTAMDLFRRRYLKGEYKTPFQVRNDYARHAYYGGRVEPFKLGQWSNVSVYDINSLYPFVMSQFEYPNPNTLVGPVTVFDEDTIQNYEGVSEVTINIPPCYIPPLPYRHDDKLYFPVGRRTAYYTHVELRHALAHGAVIEKVHSSLYAETTCTPFKEFVTDLYALRLNLKQNNDPAELVIKIMLNSLYGKFGQRLDAGLEEIRSILWWIERGKRDSVDFREIDGFVTCVVSKNMNFQPAYVNTLWAAYVTSYARLTLLKYMELAGDTLLYVDTDSVFIQGTLPVSKELGAMKCEFENVDVEIFGPKAYRILVDGKDIKIKCKGVPNAYALEYLQNGIVSFERPTGLLEAGHLKPKADGSPHYPSEWRTIVKEAHEQSPKRVLKPVGSPSAGCYLTLPHSLETLPPLRRVLALE